ncbi:MAG: hypothetical protein E7673_05045 [Ruminococcaceae bacterium]|nr:hypothetical protein [Oscillospiraceae bacterium]
MNFENLEVKHKAFGNGVVISNEGKYITVKFESVTKIFVYPDIFEKFLTLADGSVSQEILADLDSVKKAKQKILDKKHEENVRAMTKGIVIPGKEINLLEGEDEEGNQKSELDDII